MHFFLCNLDCPMDGQLGVSGENYSMPHLMDQFLELGTLGSLIDHSETKSEGPLKICSIKAGGMMSLAIDDHGALWMWGNCPQQRNKTGSSISFESSFIPIPVRDFHGHTVVKVACGSEHVVALVSAGETYKGEDLDSSWDVYEVACGAYHTALLTRKRTTIDALESVCWTFGLGDNGQLGHGTTQSVLKPEPVKELPGQAYLISVDCGLFHTSVVSSVGDVWSWGMEKGLGLCPDASFTGTDAGDASSPLLMSGYGVDGPIFHNPIQVACGAAHTVLVANDGYKLWSWGRGTSGVLGNGKTINCFAPSFVLWPPLTEDFKQPEPKTVVEESNGSKAVAETDKRLSLAMEEIELLQSKLSIMEPYGGMLHGLVFGRPFTYQDIPISLQNSGNFDIAKQWESMLESADHSKLLRLELFYRDMRATIKDKIMKRRIQEIIKECLPSSTSEK
ncbi:hypothetical protein NC652_039369 [Populus alba x Populus x berolinensis]|nr:hypothetical protein NC652_039369 [Populus alba x Populus x berolinensis]